MEKKWAIFVVKRMQFSNFLDFIWTFTFEKSFRLWLDWILKNQDWIWIVKYDSPLISAGNPTRQAENVWSWDGEHPGLTVWNLPWIATVYKVRKNFQFLLCGCYMYKYWGDRSDSRLCNLCYYNQSTWRSSKWCTYPSICVRLY